MSTLTDSAQSAEHLNGMIVLTMRSGSEVRFPVALTPQPKLKGSLEMATP